MELIERKYTDLKRDIRDHVAQQEWMSLPISGHPELVMVTSL